MKLRLYRSVWGYPGGVAAAAREVPGSRYQGIEAVLRQDPVERQELVSVLGETGVPAVVLLPLEGSSPAAQLEMLRRDLNEAMALGPEAIVVHSGCDDWPLARSIEFYDAVTAVESELGVRAAHETHRRRSLATPWNTAMILDAVPGLRLCCDFSHWVVVCERLLEDQARAVEQAASRCLHLHARVGSAQGPQVEDPGDSAATAELAAFESWWDLVWKAQAAANVEVSTASPEYGPLPYQVRSADGRTLPETLARICDWQADRLRDRFQAGGLRS